jgi:hypothetical protein
MIPILSGNVASATAAGYTVANSCRFNDDDTAYLHRTPGSEGNRKKWTFSCWLKRGNLGGGFHRIFGGNSNTSHIYFSDDDLYWDLGAEGATGGSPDGRLQTNRVFRDPSAWYHLVFALDTEQGTAGNRMRMYINGTEETSFSTDTNPSEDLATNAINNTSTHTIGYRTSGQGTAGGAWDGYMAEVVFIDGLQLAASSFGEFSEDSPTIWIPKDVSGLTFGSQGFYLDFEDSGDLGDDESGNGNDFTEVNLAATDQSTDTCTNNFATMNPLDNYYSQGTFSNGNCTYASNGSYYTYNTATFGVSTGKWYWETKLTTANSDNASGISSFPSLAGTDYLGSKNYHYNYRSLDGNIFNNTSGTSYGNTYTTNDIIGFALDLENNKFYVSKNGTWQNSANPSTGSNGFSISSPSTSGFSGNYFPSFGQQTSSSNTWQVNFGNPTFSISSGNSDGDGYGNFEYSVPSGYFSLCTKNLAEYG